MTMRPGHPRWEEFLERLESSEGCNFTQEDPNDAETIRWTCQNDHRGARAILGTMEEVNVDSSIAAFIISVQFTFPIAPPSRSLNIDPSVKVFMPSTHSRSAQSFSMLSWGEWASSFR